ncbi:MAG: antitoxin family protein [Bythopirellula sp.]|nr:antitoxin family protein [Bythopirellula sp.]
MVIHIEATYENGILRPSVPLNLPNSTPVHVTVVPRSDVVGDETDEDVLPQGPNLTVQEFRKVMEEGTIRAPSLPLDFDRDDIYSDHD